MPGRLEPGGHGLGAAAAYHHVALLEPRERAVRPEAESRTHAKPDLQLEVTARPRHVRDATRAPGAADALGVAATDRDLQRPLGWSDVAIERAAQVEGVRVERLDVRVRRSAPRNPTRKNDLNHVHCLHDTSAFQ